jgi:arginyl-tRNA synthetase
VEKAAAEFAPHTIATYLHELAQRFNTLYAQHTIVGENQSDTARRLLLTKAVQNVLREGLYLLGIRPVERM